MTILIKFNQVVDMPELAKFILRVGFAVLFLLHGLHKMQTGVDFVGSKFVEFGLSASFAYLAYIAEVVAPFGSFFCRKWCSGNHDFNAF